MTDIVEAEERINQCFIDAWATTEYADRFVLGNEDDEFEEGALTPWARFSQNIADASQETLGEKGNRKFERTGSAFAQIFTVKGTGKKLAKQLAKIVVDAFEGERIVGTTIRFNDVIPRETGPDGKWYQIVVEIAFVFDETK